MKKNFVKLSIGALCCLLSLQACDGDSDTLNLDGIDLSTGDIYSSTAITSFNIKPNSKLLAHLDSVFFTIDLLDARIFNADSLPYGTDVSKLLVNLNTDAIKTITIKYTDAETLETKEIEYSTSSTDSINFTQPVTMTVLSSNELYERVYDVKVNVHKIKPDSLCWGNMEYSALPAPQNATAQKTVKLGDKVYCLSESPAGYNIATTTTPADVSSWQMNAMQSYEINHPELSFTPDVSSFAATDNGLYIMSTAGAIYKSQDGVVWQKTDAEGWYSVIGGYGDTLIGVKRTGNGYSTATYPALTAADATPLPDGFPVAGQSQVLTYTTEWSAAPQAIFVGGRCADGSLSSATWGFDGTQWVQFSNLPKKIALEGVTLIPYTTYIVNTVNWTVKAYDTLIAFGGRDDSGKQSHSLYISRDWGMNWHLADDLMTLPSDMPAPAYAQAVVVETTLDGSPISSVGWNSISTLEPNRLWWSIDVPQPSSRAVGPITSWQCPYIYLFGGESESGTLYNTVWRGVINRMTFKPLQ